MLIPLKTTSSDDSLEECGLIISVYLFDDGFDPEYFETLDYIQAERLNPEGSNKEHAKV